MRVLVWGLGCVGTVSAACLAHMGHDVVGIDPNPDKVGVIQSGRAPVKEPQLDEMVSQAVAAGRLQAASDGVPFAACADLSLVCVGTPVRDDGSPVLDQLAAVMRDIGLGLRDSQSYHVVVIRSTVFPGTTRSVLAPLLEKHAGRLAGRDFGLAVNPEFMREGCAVGDYYTPPYTIIGELDARSGDTAAPLYCDIEADMHRVSLEQAELLKLVSNAFHALKAGFANEVGRLCESLDLDSHALMQLVCADRKLNLSSAYLWPGFAFGGSCLPKDLRCLTFNAGILGLQLPVLEAILPSNQIHIERVRARVRQMDVRSVAVLGLSFKPGTDDLRDSPAILLVRSLLDDGIAVAVYDPDVRDENLVGSNREYARRWLPELGQVLRSNVGEALRGCQAVIVTQNRPEFAAALRRLHRAVAVLDVTHGHRGAHGDGGAHAACQHHISGQRGGLE